MGFHDETQHQHKVAGWKSALASPKTPAHLREHLQKKVSEHEAAKWEVVGEEEIVPAPQFAVIHEAPRAPQRGDEVTLEDGTKGTVVFSRFGVIRVKTADGKNIRRFDWRKQKSGSSAG